MSSHEDFEQLAVGYVLNSLEPADEQVLATHLTECVTCFVLISDAELVTTALAQTAPAVEPSTGLRARLLQSAAEEPRAVALPMPEDPWLPAKSRHSRSRSTQRASRAPESKAHDSRRSRVRLRVLTGALAALVGVAVAIPTTLALSSADSDHARNVALAHKLLEPGSREVTLTSVMNPFKAKAVLAATGALVVADDLPANVSQRTTYVLWAANRSGMRTAIATFDVTAGKAVQVATASLPFKVNEITQIAVSLEPGRRAPSAPTDIVLSGSSA